MAIIDQSLLSGKIRDQPIGNELASLLVKAGKAAGIDTIYITSGGQPGSSGKRTGSTRHDKGRAADLYLFADNKALTFTNSSAPAKVKKFLTACAAYGANGLGAGTDYMGNKTMHIGFGRTTIDNEKLVWGKKGKSAFAPKWVRDAAREGWFNPPDWVYDTDDDEPEDLPESEEVLIDAIPDVPDKFTYDIIKGAQASEQKWGVPTSITLAQWALESNYGKSMPEGSNNPFGIKALPGQPSVVAWTKEMQNGKLVPMQEPFRVFPDMGAAFIEHSRLLGTSHHYTKARQFMNDPDRFADALTGIYATDTKYGSKLKTLMKQYDLYRFNLNKQANSSQTNSDREVSMSSPLTQGHPNSVQVKVLQEQLTNLGYKLGAIDGKFGRLTTAALLAFQNDNNLPTTGIVDLTTQEALASAPKRRFDTERETASEAELAAAGSRTIKNARRSRLASLVLSGLGLLGIGNSAVVNSTPPVAPVTSGNLPDQLLPFLNDVQNLSATTAPQKFQEITELSKNLIFQLQGKSLSPDVVQLLTQVKNTLTPEVREANPELAGILEGLTTPVTTTNTPLTSIFDILPTFFMTGTIPETVMTGVAAVGNSMLPGFGGSLAVLGVGLAGRYFANKIASARTQDHRTGGNLNPR